MQINKWEALLVVFVLIMSGFALVSSGQTVSHVASQVVPGTFAAGLYSFIGNLNVNNTLTVNNTGGSGNALTVYGNINVTGSIYNPSNLYMIVGNLISLVSSGDIELNATAGQIDLNSDEVYINNTHIINYTDDSAPLEIYAGTQTHIACPTGFGLAYYGWTFAGAGNYYFNSVAALFGGDLSCIQNSTGVSSMWIGESLPAPGVGIPWGLGGASNVTAMWYMVNNTAGSANNLTACSVCYPTGGEYVKIYATNSSSALTCPSNFQKLFPSDGYIYIAAGDTTADSSTIGLPPTSTSALTGGGTTCVQYPAQYVSTILTSPPGGQLPTYWHASGGDYSRCNICYRPSVIN